MNLKTIVPLMLAVFAAACVQLLPTHAMRLFPLEAESLPSAARGAPRDVVAVAVPNGAPMSMGESIIWRRDGVIGVMEGAAWGGRADGLLQGLLLQTLVATHRFVGVARAGAGVHTDLEIQWDVSRFDIAEDGNVLAARFVANVSIISVSERRILRTDHIDVSEPVARRTATEAAAALERAAQIAAAQITDLATAQPTS